MKMIAATFNQTETPEHEIGELETVTVVIPLDELAVLYRLAGHISPLEIQTIAGSERWGTAMYDIGDGLSEIFNRFFDGGVNDVIPRFDIHDLPPRPPKDGAPA